MSTKPIILIIDDESQIRKILHITLESAEYKVIEAENGKDGIIQAATAHPNLIILDLGLPDQDGYSVLKEIRTWSLLPVMILSVRNSEEDIVKALDLGADDYLTKPFYSAELLARIRASLRRASQVQESNIFTNGSVKIDLVLRTVTKGDEEIKLTATEYSLLILLAKNLGKVLTHQFILKEVWGQSYVEQSQSLRVFVGQLRKKIEEDPARPSMIITEPGIGYRMKSLND
ncbi:MAG: response regulator [Ignavibacteriales bacterium]|nr:response regulator [Ignavibacteriales bacterium]